MGTFHFAYSFDVILFHNNLYNIVIDRNDFSEDKLLSYIISIITNNSDDTRKILDNLRFDKEWLNTSDPEISKTDKWYMVALAEALRPIPSLSNRTQFSYIVLRRILPISGWSSNEIQVLTQGQFLHTMLENLGIELFIRNFLGIDQFGGWVSFENAKSFLSKLEDTKQFFSDQIFYTEALKAIEEMASFYNKPSEELFKNSLNDALDMLKEAVFRKHSIFMFID